LSLEPPVSGPANGTISFMINFFAVVEALAFDKRLGVSYDKLFIVKFGARDLADPNNDPIGLFQNNGIRCYAWRNKYWMEYNINCREVIRRAKHFDELTHFCELLAMYDTSLGPSIHDNIDRSTSINKMFYRVLYQVNEASVGVTE
jgi:hypothetical protein